MIEVEIWRAIHGYEGMYEVSSRGRVRSLARTKRHWKGGPSRVDARIMVPEHTAAGYDRIALHRDGTMTKVLVHRLVAEAFLPPSDKRFVNHMDGNKRNNAAENLEWVTAGENTRHAWGAGLCSPVCGEHHGCSVLTSDAVVIIRRARATGAAVGALANQFGVTDAAITAVVCGRTWKHIPQ